MKKWLVVTGLILWAGVASSQEALFLFGEDMGLNKLISGKLTEGDPVNWIQVNTEANTWKIKGDELI